VDPDLLRRRYFRFAPDELLKRQVTGTVDVAGLPLMGVPDVEHCGLDAARPDHASARSEKLATGNC